MNNRYWRAIFVFILISIYCLLFYFILTNQYRLDFTSFYSAALALMKDENPYRVLTTTYLPVAKKLSANLNPPIVLWAFNPLAKLNYHTALALWSAISFILGLIGAGIAFNYAFSARFLKKNWLNLYLIYLLFFSTIMNTAIVQLGAVLLFFIMLGYHFYLNNRNYLAGILWGFIIAVKLFPGLLFFYVLKQGRVKVFVIMLATFLLAWLIPLLIYGPTIYTQYYAMMTRVLWYGDSWNASIYGFIFRLFIDVHDTTQSLILIESFYIFLFFISLIWYLKKLGPSEINQINHQPFCLTLAMMLLMSPFCWLYYFPLLIFPLILAWLVAVDKKTSSIKAILIWLVCLFLINFPMDYVSSWHMTNFINRLGFFSFYFYGLLLLIYLLTRTEKIVGANETDIDETKYFFLPVTFVIFAFGLLVPTISFIMRLM